MALKLLDLRKKKKEGYKDKMIDGDKNKMEMDRYNKIEIEVIRLKRW